MFYWLVIMSLKFVVCTSLRSYLSFMFDDFDTVNLVSRHVCLHYVMLNTKNGNK
jgi:hypothetical protein